MSQVLSDIISEENRDADFNEDGNLLAQIQNMIQSDRNATGRAIRQLWFAGSVVNPNMEDSQIGAMIYNWMRKDGLRFHSINDKVVMLTDPVGYLGDQGGDVQRHVAQSFTKPFSPQYRSFLQEALDLKPVDVPHTLQQMLMQSSPSLRPLAGRDAFTPGALIPEFNPRDQSSSRMLESRANYGGAVINGRQTNGVVVNPVVSVKDAVLQWPDGSTVLVRKGAVLNIINPDLFAPLPTFTGSGGSPTSTGIAIGGSVPGQGATVNVPFQ
jgi:hypothetical protein